MHPRTLQGRPRGNHPLILCSGHPDARWADKTLLPHGKAAGDAHLRPNTKTRPSPAPKHTSTTSRPPLWQTVCFNHATTVTGSPDRIILFTLHKKPSTFMFYLKHGISSITPRPLQKVWFLHYICMRVPGKFGKVFWALLSSPFNWVCRGRHRNLLFTEYVRQGTQHVGTEDETWLYRPLFAPPSRLEGHYKEELIATD